MIELEDAQARLLALKSPLESELCHLQAAAGRWAAEPLLARRTQPAFDLSAMDGYAIRFADMPGPWHVVGESAAGKPYPDYLFVGEAVRIFTGAALPTASDTVVVQEDVTVTAETLTLLGEGPARAGHWVRPAGEDFKRNAVLIESGDRLTSARVALAALGGHDRIAARRRVKLAIASTGNELASRTNEFEGSLPDSNGPMLHALLRDLPVQVSDLGIIRDDRDALAAILDMAGDFDVIVTTGGASVGDHDLVRPALIGADAEIAFWKVAIRPGKPVLAALLGETIILALPGNPVSAFVTAHLFLRPLIAHLSGAANAFPVSTGAVLGAPLPAVGNRRDFVRARWLDGRLLPVRAGDSGALVSLAEADSLIVRPAGSPPAAVDDIVTAISIA